MDSVLPSSQMEGKNQFQKLPIEVILKIFGYFKVQDLKSCEQTCLTWATLVEETDLLRSKCCIEYKGIIFSPQSASAPPNNEARSRLGTVPGHFSPHLDRFLRDALQNPYCSTLKLKNFLWTNVAYSPVTLSMFDSTKLLGFLESNPNIARKIEHLIYYNNFFHHTRLFVKMVSVFPSLKSITAEETGDRAAFPESLIQHLTWKEAEDFDFDQPALPVVLTASEDAKMVLKNLTTLAVRNSFNDAAGISYANRRRRTPTAIQSMVKYGAQFCENLVVLDLHGDSYSQNMYQFYKDLKKILMANAKTLRTLKLRTFRNNELRINNAGLMQSKPEDPRTVYDKPRDDDQIQFQLFMAFFAGKEAESDDEDEEESDEDSTDDEEEASDDDDDGDIEIDDDGDEINENEGTDNAEVDQNEEAQMEEVQEIAENDEFESDDEFEFELDNEFELDDENEDEVPAQPRPPVVPWIKLGLNLKCLEFFFHLVRLPPGELDTRRRKTRTAYLLEFLATQTQLEQFKFGQLNIADKSTEARSAFMNQIFLNCPKTCHVAIDLAEQYLTRAQFLVFTNEPGYDWSKPIRFGAEEIISQDESFVKLTEGRANWSFYYVNWEDLDFTLIHTKSMENLTAVHIAQPGLKESLRLKVKNCDFQKILSEAKCLKSLCMEHCNMESVSDEGLTGLNVEACVRLGSGSTDTDPQIRPGELTGSSLCSLKDLRVVKLIGIGDRVTDISAQHAFCGMKLKALVLSSPKFTDDGVTALGHNLKGSQCWIVFR